jgi:hypothetical protein
MRSLIFSGQKNTRSGNGKPAGAILPRVTGPESLKSGCNMPCNPPPKCKRSAVKCLCLLSFFAAVALGSCASDSSKPPVPSAYEIEQTKRFEIDKREDDLTWR